MQPFFHSHRVPSQGPGPGDEGRTLGEFAFELTTEMPSTTERDTLSDHLRDMGADAAVWDVFGCFLAQRSARTRPLMLRASSGGRLAGIAFLIECTAYGRALFDSPLLTWPIDFLGIPAIIWLRAGLCAETFANPGFVAAGFDQVEVITSMLTWLRLHSPTLVVNDTLSNRSLHASAREFPYVPDSAVDLAGMADIADYIALHNNLKRKIKSFANKGGTIDMIEGPLSSDDMAGVAHCVNATIGRSIIDTPFRELFPRMVAATCACPTQQIVHLIARRGCRMLGYHTFVRTGRSLLMLHGAFDRSLDSTLHAYENLIVRAVAHSIDHRLEKVGCGPVLNETKRRMMNTTAPAALFFSSNNPVLSAVIPAFVPHTKMQSEKLLAFR